MYKKIGFLVVFSLFVTFLYGCDMGKTGKSSSQVSIFDEGKARAVVESYFKKVISGDYAGAYELLANKEKKTISLDELNPDKNVNPSIADGFINDLEELRKTKSSFKVKSIEKQNGVFKVTADYEYPDGEAIYSALPRSGWFVDWEGGRKVLKQMVQENRLPMEKTQLTMKVIKENGNLKLDFGWFDAAEKRKKEVESYKANLKLHDVKIDNYSDSAWVTGYIKNNGTKLIDSIYVTVYYLDKEGKPMGEDVGVAYVENNSDIPIRPNYDGKFIFEVPEGIRKSWGKKAEVKITGLEFVQEDNK